MKHSSDLLLGTPEWPSINVDWWSKHVINSKGYNIQSYGSNPTQYSWLIKLSITKGLGVSRETSLDERLTPYLVPTCLIRLVLNTKYKYKVTNIQNNLFRIFDNSQLVKVSGKIWLRSFEISKYFDLAIWACGAKERNDSFMLMLKRFKNLYIKFGKSPKGFALYLKEALRMTTYFLANYKVAKGANAPSVKCDSNGLPTIIPSVLRRDLVSFKERGLVYRKGIVVCILTLLSIFRVVGYKVKPNLASILKPFKGTTRSFDSSLLKLALKQLSIRTLKLSDPILLVIEKASPNASKSAWSSSLDAVAFIYYPKV